MRLSCSLRSTQTRGGLLAGARAESRWALCRGIDAPAACHVTLSVIRLVARGAVLLCVGLRSLDRGADYGARSKYRIPRPVSIAQID